MVLNPMDAPLLLVSLSFTSSPPCCVEFFLLLFFRLSPVRAFLTSKIVNNTQQERVIKQKLQIVPWLCSFSDPARKI